MSVDRDFIWPARLMLAFAIASGGLLMVVDRADAPLVIDEHVSYWIAGASSPGTLSQRSLDYAATPLASALAQRAALSMGGNKPVVMRSVSWVAFVLAIVVTFFIGVKLDGRATGALAACALAWHPEIVDVMRLARPYALSVLFAACGIWATVQWAARPRSRVYAALFVAFNAALIWTHYLNAPLVLLEAVVVLFPRLLFGNADRDPPDVSESRPQILFLAACAGVVLSVLPLVPSFFRILETAPFLNFLNEPPGVFETIGPFWWVGIPAGLAVAIAIQYASKQPHPVPATGRRSIGALVLLGFVPVVVLVVASHLSQPALGQVRYRVAYAPAAALLFAVVLRQFARPSACFAGMTVGLACAWGMAGDVPWKTGALASKPAPDWKELAEYINRDSRPGEPLFVHSGLVETRLTPAYFSDPMFMDYAACRFGGFYIGEPHPRHALPWSGTILKFPQLANHYRKALAQANRSGQDVWLAVGIDTDIGRDMLNQFSALANSSGFQVVKEYRTSTTVLVRFRVVEAD